MKILKLTIKNFLKLKDVEINPKKTNVIMGKNKQGKTSILKAIQAAFNGEVDEKSINKDAEKAEIIVELDEYKIERTVTKSGNYLDVSNKDGWKVPAPQKFLNGLIGQFSFNPIDFFNLKGGDKKKYLLQAIDIKLTPEMVESIVGEKVSMDLDRHALEVVEELRKHFYSQRTVVNAEVTKKTKTIDSLQAEIPKNYVPESVKSLDAKIDSLQKQITDSAVKVNERRNLLLEQERIGQENKHLEEQLSANKARLVKIAEIIKTEPVQDTTGIEDEIMDLRKQQKVAYTFAQVDSLRVELMEDEKQQARLDGLVKKLSKEVPDKLIQDAKLPVEGLGISEDGITLGGIDIDNLSASEQLRFALQIVRKLNEKFKIINIDGIETLDKENFEAFMAEIEADDFQYFVTRVDGDGKGFLVENGKVTEVEAKK